MPSSCNRLGDHPFIDWDESIYAQVAKEALDKGKFLSFSYFGQPWYEKPPLVIWLLGASFVLLGPTELAARLWVGSFAVATVALSVWWMWRLSRSYVASAAVIAFYGLSFPFITTSYFLNFDSIATFWILLALYAFWEGWRNPRWYLVFGAAVGLGVLTKNVVGFLPLLPIGLWIVWSRQWPVLRSKFLWWGVALAIILTAPWHIYQSIVAGRAFWENYFWYHVLNRYTNPIETNGKPFLFYFDMIFLRYPVAGVVFGLSALSGLVFSIRDRAWRLVWLSAATLFLVMSISQTKLEAYITVAIPCMVILTGWSFTKLLVLIRQPWLRAILVVVIIAVCGYTTVQFNRYKLAKLEASFEYLDNKSVGSFLKDYRRDLPVYINAEYKNLGIGFYASRPVSKYPGPEKTADLIKDKKQVFHTATENVFELPDKLIIVR